MYRGVLGFSNSRSFLVGAFLVAPIFFSKKGLDLVLISSLWLFKRRSAKGERKKLISGKVRRQ